MSEPRLAAVIGSPVAHSLSPAIHSAWATDKGVDYRYDQHDPGVADGGFERLIERLRQAGYAGVNVTIPFKERALALAGVASQTAASIGAANMLTFADDDIHADNSDAVGFAESCRAAGLAIAPRRALVLGAGGAARAIVFALKHMLNVKDVVVVNRTTARAEELAMAFDVDVAPWAARHAEASTSGLIVNTTSIGMKSAITPFTDEPFIRFDGVEAAAVDIVYSPLETPFLAAARAHGLIGVDGLEMLIRQAAPGFERWSGAKDPDIALARRICEESLAGKGRQ
ncbi:MAG: shikimate dehydrogenase [Alphaproteobacteria bacterium]|nr:shikimate dehydrogenase [Alphaproteobacteria bacterium]